ncbi:MAG: carboxylesterase family protein [Acidobacteriia bacterium]|nr:carboxylesterase family protein [Terriglobia bacterium]
MTIALSFRRMAIALFCLLVPVALAAEDSVRIESGLISGVAGTHPEIRVYRGIPFAAPPVGDLRWKAPQPVAPWKGVREAKEFGAACLQKPYPAGSIYQSQLPKMNEDCLYLNVWTGAKSSSDRRPVMVWIYGGGFTRGASSISAYDGENFAGKGVVLVTFNYRLGVFGFFAHPELTSESPRQASGNYAMLDQIAALQWVQKNIAAFGGDPKRVTIFGESAGSEAVSVLMASPLAKSLFVRAIGESGGAFFPMAFLAEAEKIGQSAADALIAKEDAKEGAKEGAKKDAVKTLRAKSGEELLNAMDAEQFSQPMVDGWVLPQDVFTIFAQGKQNDVALIAGFNADEGKSLAPLPPGTTAAMLSARIKRRFGDFADQFLKIYPAGSDEEARASYYAAFRDQVFGWEMRTWARASRNTGHAPAYLYYFTRVPPGMQSQRFGAFHAADIAYVFGNFIWPFPWEEADHKLSATISGYWVNFAASGNPNGNGLPKWPEYDAQSDQYLELGDKVVVHPEVSKSGLDFFNGYYQSLRAPKQGAQGTSK